MEPAKPESHDALLCALQAALQMPPTGASPHELVDGHAQQTSGVGVTDGVRVIVGVRVTVRVAVTVTVSVGDGVGVLLGELDGELVGVGVGDTVGVSVGVCVGVQVSVGVLVSVTVWVAVTVTVGVRVNVAVGVFVMHRFEPPTRASHDESTDSVQLALHDPLTGTPHEFVLAQSQHRSGVGVTVPVRVTVGV